MNNIEYKENDLYLPNTVLSFPHNIDDAILYDDKVLVLLDIPNDVENYQNILAFDKDAKFLWKVQSQAEVYNIKDQSPFVGMTLRQNGVLTASTFYGLNFDISVDDGKLLAKRDGR